MNRKTVTLAITMATIILIIAATSFAKPTANAASSTGWEKQDSGVTASLLDICFIDISNGWAVGGNGTIIHTSDGGTTWTHQNSGTNNDLLAVNFLDTMNGWTAGKEILLMTSDGGVTWWPKATDKSTGMTFRDVVFVNATFGLVIGGDSTGNASYIVTFDGGNNWVYRPLPNSRYVTDVDFIDGNNTWMVGLYDNTTGVYFNSTNAGMKWSGAFLDMPLMSVDFVDQLHGWIAGAVPSDVSANGRIYSTTNGGKTWSQYDAMVGITDLKFASYSRGWAVGYMGVILCTANGGTDWTEQNGGTMKNLYAISVVDVNNSWIAGAVGTVLHTADGGGPVVAEIPFILPVITGIVAIAFAMNRKRQKIDTCYIR
jgi:photosystem II stability/assembly factor-like uncharacterized protein